MQNQDTKLITKNQEIDLIQRQKIKNPITVSDNSLDFLKSIIESSFKHLIFHMQEELGQIMLDNFNTVSEYDDNDCDCDDDGLIRTMTKFEHDFISLQEYYTREDKEYMITEDSPQKIYDYMLQEELLRDYARSIIYKEIIKTY